ncbi:MAG: DUF1684 domain-containing protein [Bacteroidota bacterium]
MRNLIIILTLFFFAPAFCQDKKAYETEIKAYQQQLNDEYKNPKDSPMKDEDQLAFTGHEFFKPNLKYRVVADFKLTPEAKVFEMARSKGNTAPYRKYGEATFMIGKKKYTLALYQNQKLMNDEKYKNELFIPFRDRTNGLETYGGGRFMDVDIPAGNTVIIDFNKSYNPYCCYNEKYSCPLPPKENILSIEIRAGIKTYKAGKH